MKGLGFIVGTLTGLMLLINQDAFSQLGIYAAGDGAGASNTSGDFNTFIGDSAGYTNTTGLYNTFIGYRAGYSLSFPSFTQSDNTVIGAEAMGGTPFSVSSTDNVIIGKMAGYNHYGSDVVIIGTHAGYYNENGADVVFVGEESGYSNTTGDDNVFVGEDAGYSNTTASDNTFVGNQAGRSNTTGTRNAFFGNEAGWDNTIGYRNTFIGDSAGIDVSNGNYNTFIGQASGAATEYSDFNTFVGARAGWDNNRTNETNNANYNTYLGYRTGFTNREGQYNVLLGALTDFSSTGMNGNGSTNSYNIGIGYDALINGERVYSCVIGPNAKVSSDHSCVIGGTTSATRMSVGIGTDTPNQNASLELAESNKGFLVTRMSNSEKTTFSSSLSISDEGMMVYDSTNKRINIWDGSQWLSSGIQTLGLASNTLTISSSNSVDLSPYLDNTDAQTLSLTGTNLSVSGGNTIDVSSLQDGYEANTDEQDLQLSGNTLSLTNDATPVDLSGYLDNTDEQTLSLAGTELSIAGGNTIDVSSLQDGYEANTDEQDLQLSGNTLSLTNDATPVDLSGYLDNTDGQTLSLTGTNLSISGGNTIDVSSFQDGYEANTDEQDLQLSGNTLSLTNDATPVDLSGYLDNTDKQTLSLTGTNLSISGGNTIDVSSFQDGYEANTDEQILSFDGSILSITNGNSVNLTALQDGFEANTDQQTLSVIGTALSISGGNTVDLSELTGGTDDQNLTNASLSGTMLQIEIENGSPVSVDLASLLVDINNRLDAQEGRISQLEADVALLRAYHEGGSTIVMNAGEISGAELYQNIPNPSNSSTRINYYLPNKVSDASILVYDLNGRMHMKVPVNNYGMDFIEIPEDKLQPGAYFYTLLVDGHKIATKKMIIQ